MAGDLFTEHSHPPRNEKRRRIKRANKELKRVRMKIQKSVGGWRAVVPRMENAHCEIQKNWKREMVRKRVLKVVRIKNSEKKRKKRNKRNKNLLFDRRKG